MKIAGQYSEAFVLGTCLAAIAQHATVADKCQPMVQIVSLGMGLSVVGVDALEALREAIEYALCGPPKM